MFVTSIDVRFLKNTNTKYIIYPNFNNPEQIYNPKEREREKNLPHRLLLSYQNDVCKREQKL